MPLVFTQKKKYREGKYKKSIGTFAFDNSYPTGGEDYSATLGSNVLSITIPPYAGYCFGVDYTNKKILAYVPFAMAGSAAAAGTDAISIKANVVNKEEATDMQAAQPECLASSDLSGLTAVPGEVIFLK